MQFSLRLFFIMTLCMLAFGSCSREETPAEARARTVFSKAKAALMRGDHRESNRLLREANALYEQIDKPSPLAETSLLLGEIYSAAAEFDSAFILFARSRELYQQVSDKSGIRATVLALAATHRTRGEDQQAYAILMEELRLEEALKDLYGSRELKWQLIPVCRALGDGDAEQRFLKELLTEYVAAQDVTMRSRVHLELGNSWMNRSNYSEAGTEYAAALLLAQQSNDAILVIRTHLQLGLVSDRMGKSSEAFREFSEGIRLSDRTRGAENLREEILFRVGNMYLRQRQYGQAHKFLNIALRSAIISQNKLHEAYALLQLGWCLNANADRDADALTDFRAGADLASHIGLPSANAYAQSCLGFVALRRGKLSEALEYFHNAAASDDSSLAWRDACGVLVDCENSIDDAQWTSPYDALIDLLFQVGKTDEAFLATAKRNRNTQARLFNSIGISTRNPEVNKVLQSYANVRGTYVGAERQLVNAFSVRAESRSLATAVQRSLTRSSARMFDLADSIAVLNTSFRAVLLQNVATPMELQQRVPEGSALVVYVPTKGSLYTFIVTRSKTTVQVSAVDKSSLRSLMVAYMQTLRQANRESEPHAMLGIQRRLSDLSFRLYEAFIRPVELGVPNTERLLVVMPMELPLIPLHALQREGHAGEFAIQRHSIRYLPYTDALLLKSSRMNAYPVVVGFGNQGRTSVDVEYEVRDAKAFYKDAKLYLNHDATLARVQRESGDILHAAFELEYRPDQPANSFFVLADGTGYASTRYYRFGELFSIAPFATVMISNLSATELNPILPAIFLMNGAADVVVNAYAPLRRTKKFLNEVFYTNLLAGVSAEDAYRNALLEMIKNKEYLAPNMWAGYFLW